ncbi:hypothetical protein E2C01_089686 [Portunus trituberculatus]|uniref:Uncharacterized protein n=1 Tax=Portunus trituberculatus TaxID=210409 RepID=A0A5B7JJG2_PORTR|nr:hypothetical protein [Portunus trituberculatus]
MILCSFRNLCWDSNSEDPDYQSSDLHRPFLMRATEECEGWTRYCKRRHCEGEVDTRLTGNKRDIPGSVTS